MLSTIRIMKRCFSILKELQKFDLQDSSNFKHLTESKEI